MELALLKLGGSIVTFKNKPVSVNKGAIERISKQLRKVRKPLIVVHGGGSFGHYYSVRYDMHTKLAINGLIPITHGDVLHYNDRSYYILSGDVLMSTLAKELKPDIVVFALDVDGIYSDPKSKKLIREIRTA